MTLSSYLDVGRLTASEQVSGVMNREYSIRKETPSGVEGKRGFTGLSDREEVKMLSPSRQWKHFAAMVLIGDGVMALVHPQRDAEAWAVGPQWWQKSMRFFRDCPTLTRIIAATQVAGGIYWALSQESKGEETRP